MADGRGASAQGLEVEPTDGQYPHGAGPDGGIAAPVSAEVPRAYVVSLYTPQLTGVVRWHRYLESNAKTVTGELGGTIPTELGLLANLQEM